MMKSISKHNVSGSNKESVLSELQKEKEKIVREMKELEYRRKREQQQKKEKAAPAPLVINERNIREKTPPQIIKKIPRVEPKSFKEVMEEAEKRSKQNQVNPEKRKYSESNLSASSIKKKTPNEQTSIKNVDIPLKKQRLNDYVPDKSKPAPLKSINSARKPEPINSSNYRSISHSSSDNSKTNSYSQKNKISAQNKVNLNQSSSKSNGNQNSSKSLKNGIISQSNYRPESTKTGILAQSSSSKSMKNGHIPQSNSRFESQSTKTGICAQSNSKSIKNGIISQSNSRLESQSTKSGILAQSNSKINSQSSVKFSSQSSMKNSNSNQNSSQGSLRNTNDNRNSSLPRKQMDNRNSYNSNKPNTNQNYNTTKMKSNSRIDRGDRLPTANRGICAQNSSQYQSSQNFPSKNAYSVPQARGIAAQNGARGILAQSMGRVPNDNFYSGSEEDDEYDSELGSFIDDTEAELTEQMRSDIYKSLNHDPNKYSKVSKYDDCKNMESKFNEICKEEIRSYRIAREEDNQELREEEKRLKRKGKLP